MRRRCKCLIVDDHPIFRKGIKDLLIEEGLCHVVVEAASAETAIVAICREPGDLRSLTWRFPTNMASKY